MLLPLKDDIPSRRFPFVTYSIIAVNIVVFMFEATMSKEQLQAFFELIAVIPAEYTAFLRGEPVPLLKLLAAPFASMFLHGGWMHLFGNMWFLYLFGDNVEDAMGHSRFLLFYLLTGLAATVAHIFVNPLSSIPIVGASGAISGVVGAYFLMFPTARVLTLVPIFFFVDIVLLPAVVFIGMWFLFQFWSGLLSLAVPHMGGVAWWAHIGGFIAGLILAPIMREKQKPIRYRIRVYHRYW
ncbi:Membrane associated serine protease, rhomboid family [Candidatus Fervidibacteria bacterium JGI MDM2 JNZ-1-D12]